MEKPIVKELTKNQIESINDLTEFILTEIKGEKYVKNIMLPGDGHNIGTEKYIIKILKIK